MSPADMTDAELRAAVHEAEFDSEAYEALIAECEHRDLDL